MSEIDVEFNLVDSTSKYEYDVECLGSIYRVICSNYASSDLLVDKTYMKKLKRYSCPGCQKCDWESDEFANMWLERGDRVIPDDVVHGACYELTWHGGEYVCRDVKCKTCKGLRFLTYGDGRRGQASVSICTDCKGTGFVSERVKFS